MATLTKPGRHADGGNLYLNVSKAGNRSWVFMYAIKGRQREMGLGPLRDVPLAKARQLAAAARRQIIDHLDPLAERDRDLKACTFGECADSYVEAMKPQWANAKHAWQWSNTLTKHAASLRPKQIAEVATSDVLEVLQPLWLKIPETASRLRGRIESVLDSARARGLRVGENPARWRGHLEKLLPRRQRLSRGHQRALPYLEIPAFMARLQSNSSLSSHALQFTILTAVRTGEVIGAKWPEFDLAAGVWIVPAARMKMKREHRVPLSSSAVAIVQRLAEARFSDFVFPLSNMAMLELLRGMGLDVVTHGFRSSFRDWAAETTSFPAEVAEMALAHLVRDSVERAYRRGDLFAKRRELMDAWANYCDFATVKAANGS